MSRSHRHVAIALLAVCSACGGSKSKPRLDLVVTSFSPTADTDDPATPIKFVFDQPVVTEEEVGAPVAEVPVTIEPTLAVDAHWADRQTLVLKPSSGLAASTRYQVTLTGKLGARAGASPYSFVHKPLAVEGLGGGANPERLPPRPDLILRFNQPVKAADVVKFCKLVPKGGSAVELTTADAALVDAAITVGAGKALAQGTDYELRCDKLGGAGGNVGMSEPYTMALHTYPTFKVAAFAPQGDDVAPDELQIELTFSTPVDLEEVRKAVSMKPEVPGVHDGWLDDDSTKYTVVVNLETTTEYTVSLPKGMPDSFAQSLAEPASFTFTTGNAAPRLSMDTGIYAVEAASAGYPIWTRNVGTFVVECAAVPKARAVALLAEGIDYEPYYDADEDKPLDWKKLGLKTRSAPVALSQVKNKWNLTSLKLGEQCGGAAAGQSRGLYLAEVTTAEITPDPDATWRYKPRRRVLANVTNLGVLLKAGSGSGLAWVTGLSDGKPVAGASVTLFSTTGKQVFKGTSDASGLVRLPGTAQLLADKKKPAELDDEGEHYEEERYGGARLIAVVEAAGDMAVVDANWTDGLQSWNFNVTSDYQAGATRIRGFIQSDRGIYRPGETVHFKGLVREVELGKPPRVPSKPAVAVTVTDSRGSTVYEGPSKLTPYGGFSFDLPLGAEASLGDYYVAAKIADQTFNERFQVEEFRKVTFELKMDGGGRQARIGETLGFDVTATYLFGAPVARAKAEWSVQRRPHYLTFPKLEAFSFTDWAARGTYDWWYWDSSRESEEFVSDGDGTTDAKGKFAFKLKDPQKELDGPYDYMAQVTITDETDQSVSSSVALTAHKSDFYLGLRSQEYVQEAGKAAGLDLVAVGPDGAPLAAKANLIVIRQTWECHYSDSGYRTYSSCETKEEQVSDEPIALSASGPTVHTMTPAKPGEYIVRLAGVDGRGNKVSASTYLWVVGKGEAYWAADDEARMSLIASKASYEPGDTARLVPRTALTGHALVTVERNGIIEASVRELASSGEGIEVPITDAFAPNVFASVTVVRGRGGEGDKHRPRLQMGVVDLKVSAAAQRLAVEVATDQPIYEPGQSVTGTIRVKGQDGQPVSAEVALSVADEGVLQLIAYQTPDPMKSFYADWGLGVESSTNWTQVARLNDPTESDEDEGGDAGGGEGPGVRSRFVSSAHWAPSLMTDEKGEIRFAFQAPDNLTAFRLMAVAADSGSRFGSGDNRMTIRKPLLAQPILPRFLASGDNAEVGVLVFNYTGAAGTATVTAVADGMKLGKTEQTVQIPDGGSERVRFTGSVGFTRQASFQFSVKLGAATDALKLDLPVERPLVIDRKSLSRGALDGTTATVPVAWDNDALPRDSMLAISVDRTGMSELEGSLRYLIEYPYGCLEQTLSRTIPLVKVQDLANSLDLAAIKGPRLRSFIKAGVIKVIRHQHPDGHFSLWPNGETQPELTVYAMYGLNEARRSKIEVDADALERGVNAMKSWVNEGNRKPTPDGEGATMAMAAFVLADMKQPDAGLNARLFEARRGLPRYGQAFLLMALKLSAAPADQLKTLEDEILAAVEDKGDTAIVKEVDDEKLRWYMSSDVRTSAITVSALLLVDPTNPVIDKLVEGLKKAQRPGGYWDNTEDNLYGLVALADYARRMSQGTATVTIAMDGKQVAKRTLKGSQVLAWERKLGKIKPGTLTITSQGPARYSVRLVTAKKELAPTAQDNGFAVTREYLDPQTDRPVKEIKGGQLVKVRLTLTTKEDRNYVALVDPLPAGFEAVNSKLSTSARRSDDEEGEEYDWEPPLWTYSELRDSKALAFANRMDAGTHTFEYLARATLPGKFNVAPAHAEAMYEPEVYGRTGALEVAIKR